ncbi:hypothetical protein [Salipaludibacillus sp. CF4.18]|uniref:hypothetical protein n=1 Tax=Salipaludibacillus sp. CF4.18 TaxID=3373081 RepID=UPI003EE7724F
MIKQALEYIVGMGKAEIHNENGQAYSDKELHLLKQPVPNKLSVSSLSGLVDYIESNFDTNEKVMIHVNSPVEVSCFSMVNDDMRRNHWITAEAWVPEFRFDRFYDTETINIKLQSTFVKNEDRDIMLQVVGSIQEEAVQTIGDDGTSQSVIAKTGVASVGKAKVPNPVKLAPYRTFVEVSQPESAFVFRMQSGPTCALFEADGGTWKLEAMNNIKEYLQEQLLELIKSEKVYIIG